MHDPAFMGSGERGGDLGGDLKRPCLGYMPADPDALIEAWPRHMLHNDVIGARIRSEVVHGDEIRVAESGGGAGLAPETLDVRGVRGKRPVEHLENDRTMQELIACQIDRRRSAHMDAIRDRVPSVNKVSHHVH